MKEKIDSKKLTLNKETITDLTKEKMNAINGGYPFSTGSFCLECNTFEC